MSKSVATIILFVVIFAAIVYIIKTIEQYRKDPGKKTFKRKMLSKKKYYYSVKYGFIPAEEPEEDNFEKKEEHTTPKDALLKGEKKEYHRIITSIEKREYSLEAQRAIRDNHYLLDKYLIEKQVLPFLNKKENKKKTKIRNSCVNNILIEIKFIIENYDGTLHLEVTDLFRKAFTYINLCKDKEDYDAYIKRWRKYFLKYRGNASGATYASVVNAAENDYIPVELFENDFDVYSYLSRFGRQNQTKVIKKLHETLDEEYEKDYINYLYKYGDIKKRKLKKIITKIPFEDAVSPEEIGPWIIKINYIIKADDEKIKQLIARCEDLVRNEIESKENKETETKVNNESHVFEKVFEIDFEEEAKQRTIEINKQIENDEFVVRPYIGVKEIPISLISVKNFSQPKRDDINEIKEDYFEYGKIKKPVEVSFENNEYCLEKGYHIYCAAKDLELKTVPAEIVHIDYEHVFKVGTKCLHLKFGYGVVTKVYDGKIVLSLVNGEERKFNIEMILKNDYVVVF